MADIRFGVEPMKDCWCEAFALASDHFDQLGIPYMPSHDRYKESEDEGQFFIATMRDRGELVGFGMMYVFQSMHDQSIQAQEDFFYLLPEYRKGWNALKLLSIVEDECAKRGCETVTMTAKVDNLAGAILSGRRYAIVSQQYSKLLVRADSPSPKEAVQ